MAKAKQGTVRHLHLILGDQLDRHSSIFDGFEKERDAIWMAEVEDESTHVWSHKARIALFLSAMRHFGAELEEKGYFLYYTKLDDKDNQGTLAGELGKAIKKRKPKKLIVTHPGDWRVMERLKKIASEWDIPLDMRDDTHFLCPVESFREYARRYKQLRLEYFYRDIRKREGILMDGSQPMGGSWNFDKENRQAFSKNGPEDLVVPYQAKQDKITKDVIKLVEKRFASHPGSLRHFADPVTERQAENALRDFIQHRLVHFGPYQDAMWTDAPFLFHSRLSSSLNLKLLHPRKVIAAAEEALDNGHVPIASVEGFVRQVAGWREYVRGIYWLHMPEYLERNALGATEPLPDFYWTGETEMECLRQAISQTLEYGYAHHIQRLMVTGLFALLFGVHPKAVHEWYLAIYIDAVEWVELPNTLGMSQYADGGVMASKPYCASGKYIQRMSNYCKHCRYNPAEKVGEAACPFTTLYWDYLMKHEKMLSTNSRMTMQLRNLSRLSQEERKEIQVQSRQLRKKIHSG